MHPNYENQAGSLAGAASSAYAAKQVRDESALSGQFNELNGALGHLTKLVSDLEERTQPVRYPQPPTPLTSGSNRLGEGVAAVPSMSEMENRASNARHQVESLTQRISLVIAELRI